MAQQLIDTGTTDNDGNGDVLKVICQKANANFSELYSAAGGITCASNGVVADGSTNDLTALLSAVAAANAADSVLVAGIVGVVKLAGDDDVVITCSCDFTGILFDVENYTGQFLFEKDATPVVYTAPHAVCTALEGSSDLSAGSSMYDGWDGVDEVTNSHVIIQTDQDFYEYNGVVQKRQEINRVYRDGVVKSPLQYDLTGVTINSVTVFERPQTRKKLVGLTFLAGSRDTDNPTTNENVYLRVKKDWCLVEAHLIIDDFLHTGSNPIFVYYDTCHDVTGHQTQVFTNRTTSGSTFNYGLDMRDCYDLTITAEADGDGWGACGSNRCHRLTFINSNISRIDHHNPFREYLKCIDCDIGDWGVLVNAIGDLILIRPRFKVRDHVNTNNSGLIRCRNDAGGFCDGDLIIKDARIDADSAESYVEMISHNSTVTNTKPAGSPINYRFWRNITIDGLTATGPFVYLRPVALTGNIIDICESVNVRNVHADLWMQLNVSGETPSRTGQKFGLHVDVDNCTMSYLGFQSDDDDISILADIRNVRPYRSTDFMRVEATADCVVNIHGGQVSDFDFYSGGNVPASNLVAITCFGTQIEDIGANDSIVVGSMDNVDLRFIDCPINFTSSGRIPDSLMALHIRSKIMVAGVPTLYQIDGNPSSGTYTIPEMRDDQPIMLWTGYTSDSTLHRYVFNLPPATGNDHNVPVMGWDGSAVALGGLHRANSTELNVTGSLEWRGLYLPQA